MLEQKPESKFENEATRGFENKKKPKEIARVSSDSREQLRKKGSYLDSSNKNKWYFQEFR